MPRYLSDFRVVKGNETTPVNHPNLFPLLGYYIEGWEEKMDMEMTIGDTFLGSPILFRSSPGCAEPKVDDPGPSPLPLCSSGREHMDI